ncbi:MAG TPA: hypothetical protein VNY04_03260, partial [Chthoniobacterales bacterium]|nr:hypothetical protein [Chthoniobacterales bacterium]
AARRDRKSCGSAHYPEAGSTLHLSDSLLLHRQVVVLVSRLAYYGDVAQVSWLFFQGVSDERQHI